MFGGMVTSFGGSGDSVFWGVIYITMVERMDGLVTTCRSSSCDVYNHGEKSIKQSPGKNSSKDTWNQQQTTWSFCRRFLGNCSKLFRETRNKPTNKWEASENDRKLHQHGIGFGEILLTRISVQTQKNIQSNYKMIWNPCKNHIKLKMFNQAMLYTPAN